MALLTELSSSREDSGAGDAGDGQVVVGGADAAGGEHERGAGEEAEEGGADGVEVVLDGADLDEADPAAAAG